MATPSNRVPVRIARGAKAALDAGLADLQEGEVCYATDENALYVVEGGVLISIAADLTGIEIINDTTPQLGGNLDINSFQIISTTAGNIQIAPDTTGVLEVMGNTGNDAAIQLNCETNAHGIKLKSPPHSAAASYTLVFPNDTGTSGQALTTDGAGVMSWTTPSTVGSINDLTDVDTTTAAPTDGQALIWDNANSEWVPGDVAADLGTTSIDALQDVDTTTAAPTTNQVLAWDGTNWVPADQSGGGGGAVDSVNGKTGAVVLDVEDLDNVKGAGVFLSNKTTATDINNNGSDGDWDVNITFRYFYFYNAGSDNALMSLLQIGDSVTLDWSDATASVVTVSDSAVSSGNLASYVQFNSSAGWPETGTVTVISDRFGASDGQVLTWVSANSQWEPVSPSGGGGAVDSVNGETGVVSLGIQDMDDFALKSGVAPRWDTECGGCAVPGPGQWSDQVSKIRLDATDSDGFSQQTQLENIVVNVSQAWVSQDGVGWTQTTVNSYTSFAPGNPSLFAVGFDAVTDPTTYWPGAAYISFSDPSTLSVPLAEGDILGWNDSSQEFKPTSDYISLTTLKAEVAASTDFADFQSRIAAL
jgi:hypothetical protein